MPYVTPPCIRILRQAGLLALALLASASHAAPPMANTASPKRPNIVFVVLDDVGFSDLGAYGGEIQTPNIDAIANTGVRFTNFHTASTCESSRSMMHTGIDHHRAGAGTLQAIIADNQRGQPGYEGYLSERAYSLGQLLHDGGYATYFVGKWNLGEGVARAPGAKGWDRYLSLEQTGADNFEKKVYAPLNMAAVWWQDGQPAQLPADFYSTRHYIDTMMRYIDEGQSANKPFFGLIALQANHSPLQAPDVDIQKYKDRYRDGWDKLRAERYQRQVDMGLFPAGLRLPDALRQRAWSSLSASEQQRYAIKMSVYAAMLDNADQHIGRLRAHLKSIGQLDNTVFILMSDNGADPVELNEVNLPFRMWYRFNFALDNDSLGRKGSYVHYGQDWATVSNTPFALFKGMAGEGGMRVPFIFNDPRKNGGGRSTDEFAYMTDFLPTVLDIAGIPQPGGNGQSPALLRPTGTSMLPYLNGHATHVHAAQDAIGFEATGSSALFKGGYKLTLNNRLFGDGQWHLYDTRQDPTESRDLAPEFPAVFDDMRREYARYEAQNGVVKPPADYAPLLQLLNNNWPVLLRQLAWPLAAVAGLLLLIVSGLVAGLRLRKWRRHRSRPTHSISSRLL